MQTAGTTARADRLPLLAARRVRHPGRRAGERVRRAGSRDCRPGSGCRPRGCSASSWRSRSGGTSSRTSSLRFPDGVAAGETLIMLDSHGPEARQSAFAMVGSLVASGLTFLATQLRWIADAVPVTLNAFSARGGVGFAISLLNIGSGIIIGLRVSASMLIGGRDRLGAVPAVAAPARADRAGRETRGHPAHGHVARGRDAGRGRHRRARCSAGGCCSRASRGSPPRAAGVRSAAPLGLASGARPRRVVLVVIQRHLLRHAGVALGHRHPALACRSGWWRSACWARPTGGRSARW